MKEEKKEFISDLIRDDWRSEEIINAWNDRCNENDMDDYIYINDEDFINEMFQEPWKAVQATYFGNYRFADSYVVFNGYANLDTFDFWDDEKSPIIISEIAEWVADNSTLYADKLRDEDEIKEFFVGILNINGLNYEELMKVVNEYLEDNPTNFWEDDWDELATNINTFYDTKNKKD